MEAKKVYKCGKCGKEFKNKLNAEKCCTNEDSSITRLLRRINFLLKQQNKYCKIYKYSYYRKIDKYKASYLYYKEKANRFNIILDEIYNHRLYEEYKDSVEVKTVVSNIIKKRNMYIAKVTKFTRWILEMWIFDVLTQNPNCVEEEVAIRYDFVYKYFDKDKFLQEVNGDDLWTVSK